jgi:fused signal recognition particle receptor
VIALWIVLKALGVPTLVGMVLRRRRRQPSDIDAESDLAPDQEAEPSAEPSAEEPIAPVVEEPIEPLDEEPIEPAEAPGGQRSGVFRRRHRQPAADTATEADLAPDLEAEPLAETPTEVAPEVPAEPEAEAPEGPRSGLLRRRRQPAADTATGADLPPDLETEQPEELPAEPPGAPPPLRERLGRTRGLFAPLRSIGGRGGAAALEAAEEALLRADVGVETTTAIVAELRSARGRADGWLGMLGERLVAIFAEQPDRSLRLDDDPEAVNVWLFVGVNGVGKTTTIGKVALAQRSRGRSVLLAAGDTFRAAAFDQLALWADRAGTEIVQGAEGGDPSAVVFDAVQRAKARGHDLVLADTAGRLHTKVNLLEELKKIRRVADRPPGRVTEVLLVLDATTGQNALAQARQFAEAVGVTGIVLTKLDGTAKGGVVIPIERQLGLPVKLVGVGEGVDDVIAFDPEAFVDALVGQ